MKKALIVGIDHYDSSIQNLEGCSAAATKVKSLLATNYQEGVEKGKPNFDCRILASDDCDSKIKITRAVLKGQIKELFEDEEADVALLFFSGYGFENSLGGCLMTQDTSENEEGISFNDIMIYANNSTVKEIIIILDCYYPEVSPRIENKKVAFASIRKGINVLTVSNIISNNEKFRSNVRFPEILCHVLESGGDDDVLGLVTMAEVYAYSDRILRPLGHDVSFKSNSARITVLRIAKPQIHYAILQKMSKYFYSAHFNYQLDKECLRSQKSTNEFKIKCYKNLQKMVRCGLVKPINEVHMYYAALHNKHCGLTEKGKQYWKLLKENKI